MIPFWMLFLIYVWEEEEEEKSFCECVIWEVAEGGKKLFLNWIFSKNWDKIEERLNATIRLPPFTSFMAKLFFPNNIKETKNFNPSFKH